MSEPRIDKQVVRRRLRQFGNDTIFAMLDQALELLPPSKLEQLVRCFVSVDIGELAATEPEVNTPSRLRATVEAFVEASRRGDYFVSFAVDSKNCNEQSRGTTAWIGECGRLLDKCAAFSGRRRGAGQVLVAFELLFELIEDAASCELDILFFADEGGIWEFCFDWGRFGAAWLACLGLAVPASGRAQHIAKTLERCGGDQGNVGSELARAMRRHGIPPS